MAFNPLQMLVSRFVGEASQGFAHDDPQMAGAVRLLGRFQEHLFGRWMMAESMRLPCSVRFKHAVTGQVSHCTRPMASPCLVCQQPCCLEHASVVVDSGELCCFACLEVAKQARAATPPHQSASDDAALRRKYLRLLKLKGEPDADAIRAAYKREAAKAHPDKHPEDKKADAHKRFVEIGKARDFLLARAQARAA